MGLEVSTYISGLTPTWPPSGDPKSQGDDHIRLIKSVLQNTFPTASGPFYFPKTEATSTTLVLDVTDQGNMVMVTTTGGDVTMTLPSGFTSANIGWSCEVVKVSADTNGVVVSPASGTISSRVGNTATIRVGALNEPAKFIWMGSTWLCVKPGAPIGVTQNFDGPIPYGYITLDGSTYSSTTFAELFAAYGSTTLKDKRGRVEAGVDGGVGRLTTSYFGATAVAGAVGGLESNLLDTTRIPSHSHANTISVSDLGHSHLTNDFAGGVGHGNTISGGFTGSNSISTASASANISASITNAAAGGGLAHANVQPTIVSNKAVRAC